MMKFLGTLGTSRRDSSDRLGAQVHFVGNTVRLRPPSCFNQHRRTGPVFGFGFIPWPDSCCLLLLLVTHPRPITLTMEESVLGQFDCAVRRQQVPLVDITMTHLEQDVDDLTETQARPPTAFCALVEEQRRKWLSQEHALHGGFRVICRMRPFPKNDHKDKKDKDKEDEDQRNSDSDWLRSRLAPTTSNAAILLEMKGMDKAYPVDAFFGPSKGTADVADEIEPLVNSLMSAKGAARVGRGVVLASGQTASGKTTCIRAFLRRVADLVFGASEAARKISSGTTTAANRRGKTTIECSFVQVYGDEYTDLFRSDTEKEKQQCHERQFLHIPLGAADRTNPFMAGAQIRRAASNKELLDLLEQGSGRRQTRETAMNAASSRSHGFFTMVFRSAGLVEDGDEGRGGGVLTLVDLAGSEEPSATDKESSKEGIEINESLVSLRRGMARLKQAIEEEKEESAGSNFINVQSFFRGNKMTELLGYTLGDNATLVRVLVLLTVNPAKAYMHQSQSTLEFGMLVASRVVLKTSASNALKKPESESRSEPRSEGLE